MGSVRIDVSKWPLVIHTMEGTVTDEQVDQYILEGTEMLLRGERYAVILDTTLIGEVSAYTRKRSTEWQRHYREEYKAYCVGTAYVMPSALMRFITMTVKLVTQPSTPYFVCATLPPAISWAEQQLEQAGVTRKSSPEA